MFEVVPVLSLFLSINISLQGCQSTNHTGTKITFTKYIHLIDRKEYKKGKTKTLDDLNRYEESTGHFVLSQEFTS